jgi:hypothetical protein
MSWQPMESAPRDGTRVLIERPTPGGGTQVDIAKYDDDRCVKKPKPYWAWDRGFFGKRTMQDLQPLRWMPLPEV